MKCTVCKEEATYKCCSTKYLCSLHFEPHLSNSSRSHNFEKFDLALTPFEHHNLKTELLDRISQLKFAKLKVCSYTRELVAKIDKLKKTYTDQLENYILKYSILLSTYKTCNSDYQEISAMVQSSLNIPIPNVSNLVSYADSAYNLYVNEVRSYAKTFKWDKNRFYSNHSGELLCGLISKDEKLLITGSKDTFLRVWDVETLSLLFLFEGHSRAILCVGLQDSCQFAFSGSEDRTLRVWDMHKKKERAALQHSGIVQGVTFLANSDIIVVGVVKFNDSNEIYIWEFGGLTNLNIIKVASENLKCFLYLEIFELVYFSSGHIIKSLNLKNCTIESSKRTHNSQINCMVLSNNKKILISGSEDCKIKVWDLETESSSFELSGHSQSIESLLLTNENNFLLSGSKDLSIRIWSLESKTQIKSFEDISNYSVTLLASKSNFLALMNDSNLGLIDQSRNSFRKLKMKKFKSGSEEFLSTRKVSYIVDDNVFIWNIHQNRIEKTIEIKYRPKLAVVSGEYALIACKDEAFYWDIMMNQPIAVLRGCKGKITCASLNTRMYKAACGSKDNTVRIWNLKFQENMTKSEGWKFNLYFWSSLPDRTEEGLKILYPESQINHKDCVQAVVFSKFANLLVSGGKDLQIIIWDLVSNSQSAVLKGHSEEIRNLVLTDDSKFIISAGYSKKNHEYEGVKIWSCTEKRLIIEYKQQKDAKIWFEDNKISLESFNRFLL